MMERKERSIRAAGIRVMMGVVAVLLLIQPALGVTLNEVQKDLICSCGCGKILENCDCQAAGTMRQEIQQMIAMGYSRDRIIKEMQNMYGKEILANPPKEGFFLTLWTYPVIGLAAGALVIYIISKKRNVTWYMDPDDVINVEEEDFDLEMDEEDYVAMRAKKKEHTVQEFEEEDYLEGEEESGEELEEEFEEESEDLEKKYEEILKRELEKRLKKRKRE